MAPHRSPGGQATATAPDDEVPEHRKKKVRGAHRVPAPSSAVRGRVMAAAVATGAFAAAAAGSTLQNQKSSDSESDSFEVTPLANAHHANASMTGVTMGVGGRGTMNAPPALLPVTNEQDPAAEAQQLVETEQITEERKQREAAAAREAAEPDFVAPTQGTLTSPFGLRWGTTHYGIDIANNIGTPIVAVADGVVIEAGPASGFGLWVRIKHDDGTISVYGHVHDYRVTEGERVEAGEQIAVMGNRGNSTGPHLHFEIWAPSGQKIDPQAWLINHGVQL